MAKTNKSKAKKLIKEERQLLFFMQIGELNKEKEKTWLLNEEMVIKIDSMCEMVVMMTSRILNELMRWVCLMWMNQVFVVFRVKI